MQQSHLHLQLKHISDSDQLKYLKYTAMAAIREKGIIIPTIQPKSDLHLNKDS